MKNTNIIYWVSTGLFAAFMTMSGIPNVMLNAESVAFLSTQLGYPQYIIPFLGVCKILGSIGLLIPNLGRVKEWAYAGLFFDLLGATYSVVAVSGFNAGMLLMPVVMVVEAVSYIYYHKRLEQKVTVAVA
jgi:hypothetical protein